MQKKKLFDQCGQAKTLWSMFLPEKSNQTFCFHPQKSTAWFCREPGCNFWAYEPRNWTKKSQQNLLGKATGRISAKKYFLAWHCQWPILFHQKETRQVYSRQPLVDCASPHPCSLKQNSVSIFAFSLLAVTYHSTSRQDRYVFSTKSTPLRRGSKKAAKVCYLKVLDL